jgi:TatD DNase family protein
MKLIDTHCHLYLEEFKDDLSEVLARAAEAGIEKFLLPNIDSKSLDAMNHLASTYPDKMHPMIGLHPTSVKENFKEELDLVTREAKSGKYVAIGEIGIDMYWDKSFEQEQKEALAFQLELALELDLPVVIHMRESYHEIMEVMEVYRNRGLRGVFHCFTGTEAQAKSIINFGFLLGIGGVLTFKNSKLREEIKNIGTEHLVLETDAPYLAPTPHRGKRNESAYIPLVVDKLAEIYSLSKEEIARQTTQNALNLFKL